MYLENCLVRTWSGGGQSVAETWSGGGQSVGRDVVRWWSERGQRRVPVGQVTFLIIGITISYLFPWRSFIVMRDMSSWI